MDRPAAADRPPAGPPRRPSPSPFVGLVVRTVLACLVMALLTACSGEQSASRGDAAPDQPERPEASGSVSLVAAPLTTRARVHRIYGRLPGGRRSTVRREVAAVVEKWWEAAYLGGTYPRTGFRDAFPGFTRGARARARRDVRLMSNRDIGARIDSVQGKKAEVTLDVLAVGGRARAVTARFVLRFTTTGPAERRTVVRGRLFLTRQNGPWRVFGYDVSKGARA